MLFRMKTSQKQISLFGEDELTSSQEASHASHTANAPHRRDRIWFVAYSESWRSRRIRDQICKEGSCNSDVIPRESCGIHGIERPSANTSCIQLQGGEQHGGLGGKRKTQDEGRQLSGPIRTTWKDFPTVAPICDGNDGVPTELDGITFSKWRSESVKAGGNAIVPQVAHQIFKAIQEYENTH